MSELTLESIVKLQVSELRSELCKLGLETKGTKADLLVRLLSAMNDIKLDKDLPDSAVDMAPALGVNAVILRNNETSEEHSQPLQADDDDDLHEVTNVESSLIGEGKQMHGYSEIEGRLKAGLHEIEQKLFWELGKLRSEFVINNDPSLPTRQNLITEAERLRKANDVLQQRLRCEFKNLKEETRVLSEEKRSLVTALRLISNDSEETQASRSSRSPPARRKMVITLLTSQAMYRRQRSKFQRKRKRTRQMGKILNIVKKIKLMSIWKRKQSSFLVTRS